MNNAVIHFNSFRLILLRILKESFFSSKNVYFRCIRSNNKLYIKAKIVLYRILFKHLLLIKIAYAWNYLAKSAVSIKSNRSIFIIYRSELNENSFLFHILRQKHFICHTFTYCLPHNSTRIKDFCQNNLKMLSYPIRCRSGYEK